MPEIIWSDFYEKTRNDPPWPRLVRAVSLLGRVGEALDLGFGAGRDTRYLLACGFHVTAVDREAASLAALENLPTDQLRLVQSSFEDFVFESYDLVNAHYALPYINKEQFPAVFDRLKASLRPGGIFVGQFFGVNDTWNTPENFMTFLTREQAQNQLAGMEIAEFEEEDEDGETALGEQKHWHIYHIVAHRPEDQANP